MPTTLLTVIKCPHCFEIWPDYEHNTISSAKCFRCGKPYVKDFKVKTPRFIYEAWKRVKGE